MDGGFHIHSFLIEGKGLLLIDHKPLLPMIAMGDLVKGNFEAGNTIILWSSQGIRGNTESCSMHSMDMDC